MAYLRQAMAHPDATAKSRRQLNEAIAYIVRESNTFRGPGVRVGNYRVSAF